MGSNRTGWVVAVAALLLAAACSSPASVNTDPIVVTTVATTQASTTTAAPTTSSAPPTTAAPTTTVAATTTTTVDDTEAAILEAVDGYVSTLTYDLNSGVPPDPRHPLYEMWIVEPQLSRSVQNAQSYFDRGQTWFGEIQYSVLDVAPEGDIGVVVMCLFDNTTGFEADGATVFDEPDTEILRWQVSLQSTQAGWRVREVFDVGRPCDSL